MSEELEKLAIVLGAELLRNDARIACAESCTGGWIAQSLTAVPGSSAWFDLGVVTYANTAKHELLGVPMAFLEGPAAPGAVSQPTVLAMAEGVRALAHADIAVASSGIAGPGGGTPDKPAGTVWLGWSWSDRGVVHQRARCYRFNGDRRSVRYQSVYAALAGTLTLLQINQTTG